MLYQCDWQFSIEQLREEVLDLRNYSLLTNAAKAAGVITSIEP
jgi:hypothetical protein